MLKRFAASRLFVIGIMMMSPSSAFAAKESSTVPAQENVAPDKVERIPVQGDRKNTVQTPGAQDGDDAIEILRDPGQLPEPVQRMRRLIMEAARSGDVERLRPLLGNPRSGTQLSFGNTPDDPIAFLRSSSGDDKGYEILAILLEVMESGFVEVSPGTDEAIYVWPYFAAQSLQSFTPEQLVELMTLVTAGDYASMVEFGAYNFYRAGITPEGEWIFFVAGD